MPRGRVAVIGDIAGHWSQLCHALVRLGTDPTSLRLPDDLTVIQVGDLIHRGPESEKTLVAVASMMAAQPNQWVQLLGNHEALYLPGAPRFQWHESLPASGAGLLNAWWRDGRMRVAAAVDTDLGPVLVTHAGLTVGLWRDIGAPGDVREAATILNALPAAGPERLWRSGYMLNGRAVDVHAGPVWAEAGWEVYQPWQRAAAEDVDVPFGQVHGHSTAFWWPNKTWVGPSSVQSAFVVAPRARHVLGVIGGRPFAGVDPGFDKHVPADAVWKPLVFESARVVSR